MASEVFNIAKKDLMDGTIDLDTDTIKCLLVMSNALYDIDDDTLDDITTLDEFDGANYTGGHGGAGRKTLTVTVAVDDTNNRGEVTISGNATTWTALGAGTRDIAGAIIFEEGAGESTSVPVCFVDFTDVTANGGDFTINWSSEGFLQLS